MVGVMGFKLGWWKSSYIQMKF